MKEYSKYNEFKVRQLCARYNELAVSELSDSIEGKRMLFDCLKQMESVIYPESEALPELYYNLGFAYLLAWNGSTNIEKGTECLLKASNLGYINATYSLALFYTEQNEYKLALQLFRNAAHHNHIEAIYSIGVFYENGYGVRQNYKKAADYYQQAANLGSVKAIHNLASFYRRGYGVEKNLEKAVELYNKAMKMGELEYAPYNLANMYYKGIGVYRNAVKAVKYYKISADAGSAVAKFALGIIYCANGFRDEGECLIKNAASENEPHAVIWLAVHNVDIPHIDVLQKMLDAEVTPTETYVWLGFAYQYGKGVKQDIQKARQYYLKAIHLERLVGSIEDPDAYNILADQYSGKRGVLNKNAERENYYHWAASGYKRNIVEDEIRMMIEQEKKDRSDTNCQSVALSLRHQQ